MNDPIRIVIADDSLLLREGLARLLPEHGFDVIGQAGDGAELLRKIRDLRPDVAVIDIRMPPTHTDEGLRAAEAIRGGDEDTGVLLLSQYVELRYATQLLESGAGSLGYLLKDSISNLELFAEAIRRVALGGSVVDPRIITEVMSHRRADDVLADLTERERDILALMAEGRSNHAIGQKLFLSPRTVESHIRSIFIKLRLDRSADDHRRVLAILAYLQP